MTGRVFVDTNVLVYLFDRDEPAKQARSRDILALGGEALRIVLSTQVLQEFYVSVTRKLTPPVPAPVALEAVQSFIRMEVVQITPTMVTEAIVGSQRDRISFWDALIVEAASEAGCGRVLSEDLQDCWQAGPVRIENPFRDGWVL